MTLLQHIVCPCGILRAFVIFAVSLLLLYPAQLIIFPAASRMEVFLNMAAFLDILSRTTGIITELSEEKQKGGADGLSGKTSIIIRGLLLSDYGGLLLVPVWLSCSIIYLLK